MTNDIFEILKGLDSGNKARYQQVMAYCDTRVTADEGIPAIIALDDLTSEEGGTYTPAPADEGVGLLLGVSAMLYTNLYEQRPKKADDNYPAICPAMSAVAENCFRVSATEEGFALNPYRDVMSDFTGAKE